MVKSFLEVFAQKRDWNDGIAKLIVTKYSAPQKAIIGGCGIKAEKEHQYPMLTFEKRERQNSSRNCLPKRVMNNAFAGVTNCFHSFNMFVRNIEHRKVQRSLLLYLSVIGQLEEKAGVFGHLTVFKHFRTSGHQLQNFHCHFHFLPRSLKNS